jgi:hypothetical protein
MDKETFFRKRIARRFGQMLTHDQAEAGSLLPFFAAIRSKGWNAAVFGGAIRDIVVPDKMVRPRDVDVVVDVPDEDSLFDTFKQYVKRRTRFGGLHIIYGGWPIDIWPLHRTWSFQHSSLSPTFENLPKTTFLNVEAIAVEVWPSDLKHRRVFEEKFFDSISQRVLEINNEVNPFPELSVVRALVMASRIDFAIGPNLCRYIQTYGSNLSVSDIDEIQVGHYQHLQASSAELRNKIAKICQQNGA